MIQKDSSAGRHTCKCICTKNRTSKSWSKKLAELKGEIDNSTLIVEILTPLYEQLVEPLDKELAKA